MLPAVKHPAEQFRCECIDNREARHRERGRCARDMPRFDRERGNLARLPCQRDQFIVVDVNRPRTHVDVAAKFAPDLFACMDELNQREPAEGSGRIALYGVPVEITSFSMQFCKKIVSRCSYGN